MLKQPSSADKLQPAAVATRDTAVTAVRVAGTARRLQDVSRGAEGFGQPTPPRGSQIPQRRESARDGGGQSGSYGRGQGLPDPTGGARAATVSLQGVFSPKVSGTPLLLGYRCVAGCFPQAPAVRFCFAHAWLRAKLGSPFCCLVGRETCISCQALKMGRNIKLLQKTLRKPTS